MTTSATEFFTGVESDAQPLQAQAGNAFGLPDDHDPGPGPTEHFEGLRRENEEYWADHHGVIKGIHRGITVTLPQDLHDEIHEANVSPDRRARMLLEHLKSRPLGMHWSSDSKTATRFAQHGKRDAADTPVIIHAQAPALEHIETDPHRLSDGAVFRHDSWGAGESEVPLKDSAPIKITGVTWYGSRNRKTHSDVWGHTHTATAETPVPDNHQPYKHHHDWLPTGHFFGPGKPGLDPRLFDGDRMRPEIRHQILGLVNDFWTPKYGPDWTSWAKVYLAGSEASHFYGNGDLDTLIGVDYDTARLHSAPLANLTNGEIDTRLTDELRKGLDDDHRMLISQGHETGPWESTVYVNPDSYDIRTLRPYAAYDISDDRWAVPPVQVPADFDAHHLPESDWDHVDALRQRVKEIAALPTPEREAQGAALFDKLHSDRHDAFGPGGSGLYDPRDVSYKALDVAPGHPLEQLVEWKHDHDGAGDDAKDTTA